MDKFNPHNPDRKPSASENIGSMLKPRSPQAESLNTHQEPQSKDHKICSKCQQVRPLAEFWDDDELIRKMFNDGYMVINEGSYEKYKIYAQELISLIRNNDKSSRNHVLYEVIEAIKEKAKKCRVYGNQFNEGDAIEAIEGVKND